MTVQKLPPTSPDASLALYLSKIPECPYEELGIVLASSGSFAGGMDTFIEAMKNKARSIGGHAIILGEIESNTLGGEAQSGIVIRFTDPNCRENQ